jgi:hypothetical protein
MSDTDLSGRWKPCRGEGAIAAMHEFLWQRRRGKRSDWEWSSCASPAIARLSRPCQTEAHSARTSAQRSAPK